MATVLIIDDDPGLRRSLRWALESLDHTVLEARNGILAQPLWRAHAIDLVITDMVMPGGEGAEAISALRREAGHIPIIAISGADPHFLALALEAGADVTLAKPMTPLQLVNTVSGLLPH